jgi:hypothetical protein
MKKNNLSIHLNTISEKERTPTVNLLLSIIEELQNQLIKQAEQLDRQQLEIKRLKGLPKKPHLKASKLPKNSSNDDDLPPGTSGGSNYQERFGRKKRSKNSTLKIDKEEVVKSNHIPDGSKRKGYHDFIVQELIIRPVVIKYRLERWQLPDGRYMIAKLPTSLLGKHFGPTLRAYVLYQYHHQCVTQPVLHEQLIEWGIDISKGQLNRILIADKQDFHQEKASILKTGLGVSNYIHVDDTGARHQGVNGYCTHIGNERFAWFASTRYKNRINFLELLRQDNEAYCLTKESFAYMKRYQVTPWICNRLKEFKNKQYAGKENWDKLLKRLGIHHAHYIRLVTEAALIGSLLTDGFSKEMIILSDDAGQFNVFQHALCWIHAERAITTLMPFNELQVKAMEWAKEQIWEMYHLLMDYKKESNSQLKAKITKKFNAFCNTQTDYQSLNLALKRFYANKDELLLVLKRPDIPLHNNLSERDIREYVKRRKISGSTRSDEGQQCRDTFASLKKTAQKLGVKFWGYLIDRVTQKNNISDLSTLIQQAALQ